LVITPAQEIEIGENTSDVDRFYREAALNSKTPEEASQTDSTSTLNQIFNDENIANSVDWLANRIGRQNFREGENRPHPIVLMTEIGRTMIEYASNTIWGIIVTGIGAALLTSFFGNVATVIAVAVQLVVILLTIILTPLVISGVFLSIILPLAPFVRFITAVSTWLIAIVEAVVAVPIVALGHLRTDGEGLLGPSLQGAYVIFLQLLLRPTLIVAGLVMSMALVEVTVGFVNDVFFLMLDALPTGGGEGNWLYSLIRFVGFGVMYAVLVFGLINSSFKLVDLFPDTVSKFLGTGANGGIRDDEATANFDRAVIAGAIFGSGAGGSLAGISERAGAIGKQPKDDDDPDVGGDANGEKKSSQVSKGPPASVQQAQNQQAPSDVGDRDDADGSTDESQGTDSSDTQGNADNTATDTPDDSNENDSLKDDNNNDPNGGGSSRGNDDNVPKG
jgi:hypothetical protein